MSGLQQRKWRRPHEQLSLWDDCSSEPFVASSITESPTGEVQLLEHSLDLYRLISRTAVYGPVRTVVWEGGAVRRPPYPD